MRRGFFSKKSDYPEEPYVRPSLQLIRAESIDSNATASNNPGPGRNLGRLYDAVGGQIEHLLNKTAGRRRLGPDLIAEEICNLLKHADKQDGNFIYHVPIAPTVEENIVLEKLCQKLFKYCR